VSTFIFVTEVKHDQHIYNTTEVINQHPETIDMCTKDIDQTKDITNQGHVNHNQGKVFG
jgi:hypothetical protein